MLLAFIHVAILKHASVKKCKTGNEFTRKGRKDNITTKAMEELFCHIIIWEVSSLLSGRISCFCFLKASHIPVSKRKPFVRAELWSGNGAVFSVFVYHSHSPA